jgi:hypothetical protein
MILMPPLFPFPLLFTARRILNVLLPNGVPFSGVSESIPDNADNSLFSEGYF